MTTALIAPLAALWVLTGQPGKAKLVDAQKAFDEADFEVALKIARNLEPEAADDHQRAELKLFMGQCEAAMGNPGPSAEDFRQALILDPLIALDPKTTAPDLIDRLEELRSGLRGELVVSANAPDAQIRIDGRGVGPSPFRGRLPIGKHEVEAVPAAGGAPAKKTAVVRANATVEVSLEVASPPPVVEQPVAREVPPAVPPAAPQAHPGDGSPDQVSQHVEASSSGSVLPITLLGAGAVLVGAAAVGIGYAASVNSATEKPSSTVTLGQFQTAKTLYFASWPVGIVGLGAVGFGVWELLQPRAPSVAIAPVPGGAMIAWSGSL